MKSYEKDVYTMILTTVFFHQNLNGERTQTL